MIDSTNPRQLADNIRKLWDKFKSISGDLLPSRSTATTGQILKLTGENKTPAWADEYSYTPPAYSETETLTGQKWIDGRDIYRKVYSGNFPVSADTFSYTLDSIADITPIDIMGFVATSTVYNNLPRFNVTYTPANTNLIIASIPATYSEGRYNFIFDYVKTPAPETLDDDTQEAPEEVKETKTRKKTTK